MSVLKDYAHKACESIDRLMELEKEQIVAVANAQAECMLRNGIVQLVGINHGLAFQMELGYRAGGLMPYHQMNTRDLVLRGVISKDEFEQPDFNHQIEMASKLINLYRVEPEDLYMIVSVDGCDQMMIEIARLAKEKGHQVVAVVSKALMDQTTSNYPQGKKLVDFADFVLDTHTPQDDVLFDVDGKHKMCQLNTINMNVMAQMLTAETYRNMVERGVDCPVLLSANVKGADVHNRAMSDVYLGRWNS